MLFETNPHISIIGLSTIANVIFVAFIIYYHRERKRIYKLLGEVNRSISEKNQAFSEQAARLAEAYENLWKINQRLEEEVLQRTKHRTIQQEKLLEFTQFYTNQLRGTLASMMGLLLLAENEDMSADLKVLFELMQVCTRRLEKTINDLTEKLDEGSLS